MMKRISLSLIIAAVAALACLTACNRESILPEQQNGPRGAVNTKFMLNVATSPVQTKQSASAVQALGDEFRGLTNTHLLAYTLADDGKIITSPTSTETSYDLSLLLGAASNPGGALSEAATRRVISLTIPTGTNAMLFYGKSPDMVGGYSGTLSMNEYYGHLDDYTVDNNPANTNFQLGKRLATEKVAGFNATRELIAGILSAIMNTNLTGAHHVAISEDNVAVTTADYPELSWSTYAEIDATAPTSPVESGVVSYVVEQKLGQLYTKVTSIKYNTTDSSADVELRSGSGEGVLAMVKDLWTEIEALKAITATSQGEAVVKHLAKQIDGQIARYFVKDGSGNVNFLPTFLNDDDEDNPAGIVKRLNKDAYLPDGSALETAEITALEAIKADHNLDVFPLDFDLPRGSTYIAFDKVNSRFEYPEYYNTSAMGGSTSTTFSAADYYYPAELVYFGNSPLRATNVEYSYINISTANWEKDAQWSSDWSSTHVESTSRSVAMKYNIRYGVAMLETKVGYTNSVITAGKMVDSYGVDVPIVNDGDLKLTGIVIGGQSQQVGWNFLPKGNKSGFIYDSAVSMDVPVTSTPSASNYTVVFDNYNATSGASSAQDKVYVALEFQNCTGYAFRGMYNTIPKDGYFYLVGELDPGDPNADGESTVKPFTWPTDGRIIPPYTDAGLSRQIPRVFVQDFKTTVTFRLNKNALKSAYLTVPDLSTSFNTVGLSVDIIWQTGIQYGDVVIGGAEE